MKILTLIIAYCCFNFSFAQEKVIKGTVVDQNNLPLPEANLVVKGTNRSAQADFDGNYSIKAKMGEVVVFSFVGLENNQITVGQSSTYNVKLNEGVKLEENYAEPPIIRPRVKLLTISTIPLDSIIKNKNAYLCVVNGKTVRYRKFKKIKPGTIESIYEADPLTASKFKHRQNVKVVIVTLKKT